MSGPEQCVCRTSTADDGPPYAVGPNHRWHGFEAIALHAVGRSARCVRGPDSRRPPQRIDAVLTAYRAPSHELGTKMVDYSRASIEERWAAGHRDMSDALGKLEAGDAAERWPGYTFYDGRRP
ncbi:MAG: DUF3734 domain-containing protein [Burkholderiales bacterium]